MQRTGAPIAPEPVETKRGFRTSGADDLEQFLARIQAGAVCQDSGCSDLHMHFRKSLDEERMRMPSRTVGTTPVTLPLPWCRADSVMNEEPVVPEQKPFRPVSLNPSASSRATSRVSGGFIALPHLQPWRMVSPSQRRFCVESP